MTIHRRAGPPWSFVLGGRMGPHRFHLSSSQVPSILQVAGFSFLHFWNTKKVSVSQLPAIRGRSKQESNQQFSSAKIGSHVGTKIADLILCVAIPKIEPFQDLFMIRSKGSESREDMRNVTGRIIWLKSFGGAGNNYTFFSFFPFFLSLNEENRTEGI